jgi:hypothetical protein
MGLDRSALDDRNTSKEIYEEEMDAHWTKFYCKVSQSIGFLSAAVGHDVLSILLR